ncbi:D-alanine--D-alanine ligase [Candidatus Bipolaricaulota bacterium]|nr:D-alanine--D-alanine ligase [Candidatus Bipolaricaulota bacterium]
MAVKVAVLCGGNSAEREISRRSGQNVFSALRRKGWDVDLVEIDSFDGLPQRLRPYSAVFNILHGGPGEDGTVQLLLELMGKAYVGSGPLASALAMDKVEAKKAFQGKNLPTPPWLLYQGGELEGFAARAVELGFPLVLKPRREGSSVGVRIVKEEADLLWHLREMAEKFTEFFAEKYIPGREITAAILEDEKGPKVLPLVELRPKREFFDWVAKYTPGECEVFCPALLSPEEEKRVKEVAHEAFLLLGCRDFARVDMKLGPDGLPYLLEVNTLPGMTELSLFPRAAAAAGIPYDELVDLLLRRALNRLSNA